MKIYTNELPPVIVRVGRPWAHLRSSIDPVVFILSFLAAKMTGGFDFGQNDLIFLGLIGSAAYPGCIPFRHFSRDLGLHLFIKWLIVCSSLLFFVVLLGTVFPDEPRLIRPQEAALWAGLSLASLLVLHVASPTVVKKLWHLYHPRRVVIVGLNDTGLRLSQLIEDGEAEGQRLLGFVDDRSTQRTGLNSSFLIVAPLASLAEFTIANSVSVIYICLPMARTTRLLKVLEDLRDTTASIYFVPDVYVAELIQGQMSNIGGLPIVAIAETPFRGAAGILKRALDLVLILAALPILMPVLGVIAFLIKATSKGPAIFKQKRFGLDGSEIVVLKFRTMSVMEDGKATYKQVTRNDTRVTSIGRILRKTSLDELPQVLNVLGGSMSLIGPRPHALAVNDQFRKLIPGYMVRHKVKPGITGWAQVNGYRGGDDIESMRKRIEYDLEYLRHWSIGLDLIILANTVIMLLRGDKKAY